MMDGAFSPTFTELPLSHARLRSSLGIVLRCYAILILFFILHLLYSVCFLFLPLLVFHPAMLGGMGGWQPEAGIQQGSQWQIRTDIQQGS